MSDHCARKMGYTDWLGLGHVPTWTESWCLVVVVGGDSTRRRDEWVLGGKNHQVSSSGLFPFSGCLHFPLSPCPPLPPAQSLIILGLGGYLLKGAWAWIRGHREDVA